MHADDDLRSVPRWMLTPSETVELKPFGNSENRRLRELLTNTMWSKVTCTPYHNTTKHLTLLLPHFSYSTTMQRVSRTIASTSRVAALASSSSSASAALFLSGNCPSMTDRTPQTISARRSYHANVIEHYERPQNVCQRPAHPPRIFAVYFE